MKGKAFKEDMFPVDRSGLLPVYIIDINSNKSSNNVSVFNGIDLWVYLNGSLNNIDPDLCYTDWIKKRLTEIVAIKHKDFVKRMVLRKNTDLAVTTWYLTLKGVNAIVDKIAENNNNNTYQLTNVQVFLTKYTETKKYGFEKPEFSWMNFKNWASKQYDSLGCPNTYYLASSYPEQPDYGKLFDHGFVTDAACVWGGPELKNHEIAIISRTYVSDTVIDNPPKGLKCIRLNFPTTSPGTVIATVIVKPTPAANVFLRHCCYLPADTLVYALPADLVNNWKIELEVKNRTVLPTIRRRRGETKPNFGEQPDWSI